MARRRVRIRFDGAPGPEGLRFIEVEDAESGASINLGQWRQDPESGDWFLEFEIEEPDC